jgi:hypothetical protein
MRHLRPILTLVAGLAGASLFAASALADCTGFKWPLDTELGWLAAGNDLMLKSGETLPAAPDKAIALTLQPAKSTTLPVAPGVKEQAVGEDTFSGWFTVPAGVKPGLYQVSLSTNGWIDVVQNGALAPSKGFSGRQECKTIHKSVRFEVGPGPLTVQVSGAPSESVRVTLHAAN